MEFVQAWIPRLIRGKFYACASPGMWSCVLSMFLVDEAPVIGMSRCVRIPGPHIGHSDLFRSRSHAAIIQSPGGIEAERRAC